MNNTLFVEEKISIQRRIDTKTRRTELREHLIDSIQNCENTIISAPTGLGKTHIVATTEWNQKKLLNGRPIIHLHPTQKARDEAAKASRSVGLDTVILNGREEVSIPASGEIDEHLIEGIKISEWIRRRCERDGLKYWEAIQLAKELSDRDPPWPSNEPWPNDQWSEVFPLTTTSADIIHATHQMSFVPNLLEDTILVIDEQPDFSLSLSENTNGLTQERIRRAVTAYLDRSNLPVQTYEHLVSIGNKERKKIPFNAKAKKIKRSESISHKGLHPLSWALTKAIVESEPRSNGRLVGESTYTAPPVNKSGQYSKTVLDLTIIIDKHNTIQTLRICPRFSQTEIVIGLDAYPTEELWELNTGLSLKTKWTMPAVDGWRWRRNKKNLSVIRVSENSNYFTNGMSNSDEVELLIQNLRDRHQDDFSTAITSKAAKSDLVRIMKDAGIKDPKVLTFGEQNSRNDFEDEDIGLVLGCIDPGDSYVLDRVAELNKQAKPDRSHYDCHDCNGSGCYSCNQTGKRRAPGREFVGPDANLAEKLNNSIRQQEVKQAIERYGRSPSDPTDSAKVYLFTDVLEPSLLVDDYVKGIKILKQKAQNIVKFSRSQSKITVTEVENNVDVSWKYARGVLELLVKWGYATVDRDSGKYNRDNYSVNSCTPTDHLADL